jgi:hypothetical protein
MSIDDDFPIETVKLQAVSNLCVVRLGASMPLLYDGVKASGAEYVCPMHPDVTSNEPGRCPRCGMKLVPAKATQEKSVRRDGRMHRPEKAAASRTTPFFQRRQQCRRRRETGCSTRYAEW